MGVSWVIPSVTSLTECSVCMHSKNPSPLFGFDVNYEQRLQFLGERPKIGGPSLVNRMKLYLADTFLYEFPRLC